MFAETTGAGFNAGIYSSKSYEKLSNVDTLLWQKSWQDIYKMIMDELGNT